MTVLAVTQKPGPFWGPECRKVGTSSRSPRQPTPNKATSKVSFTLGTHRRPAVLPSGHTCHLRCSEGQGQGVSQGRAGDNVLTAGRGWDSPAASCVTGRWLALPGPLPVLEDLVPAAETALGPGRDRWLGAVLA